MAEPPGGKASQKSPTWHSIGCLVPAQATSASPRIPPVTSSGPKSAAFSADFTSALFSPESSLLKARLFQLLQLFLLNCTAQPGSSFPFKGMEQI